MNVKSVSAGEYTAPPAHGPMIRLIWGMTPEASTFLYKQRSKAFLSDPMSTAWV
jgi:hypothetical protein